MIQKVDNHILRKILHRSDQFPEVFSDVGELLKAGLFGAAHELVCHKVLRVVDNNDFVCLLLHAAVNLRILVGAEYRPELCPER